VPGIGTGVERSGERPEIGAHEQRRIAEKPGAQLSRQAAPIANLGMWKLFLLVCRRALLEMRECVFISSLLRDQQDNG
jgi:hypothetical protein